MIHTTSRLQQVFQIACATIPSAPMQQKRTNTQNIISNDMFKKRCAQRKFIINVRIRMQNALTHENSST